MLRSKARAVEIYRIPAWAGDRGRPIMLDIICSTTWVIFLLSNSPSTAQRIVIAICAAIIDLISSKDARDASRSPIKGVLLKANSDTAADIVRIRSGNRSINSLERRARQIRQALHTLSADDVHLMEIDDPSAAHPYERFRLMNESGTRAIGEAVRYAVPVADEPHLFKVDRHFFTNGWVTVLDDTELAFLCMVADMQARAGSSESVPVDGQTRVGYYCLGTDGYQSHHLLERAGLLRVTRPGVRRPNGTFRAPSGGAEELEGAPLRFGIVQDGFRQVALQAVVRALRYP